MHRWKIIAAGSAAGVLLLGGGVAYASTTGPGPSTTSAATPNAKPGATHPGAKRARPLVRRAVHGTFTVRTRKGFKTVAVQRGSVTAASADSITVTSKDKQVHRYAVNGGTRVRLDRKKSDRSHITKGLRAFVTTSPKDGTSVARTVILRHPK